MENMVKAPQVTDCAQHLRRAISRVTGARGEMEVRLDTILKLAIAVPELRDPDKGKVQMQRVPLAEDLNRLAVQIDKLRVVLENMLERFESTDLAK